MMRVRVRWTCTLGCSFSARTRGVRTHHHGRCNHRINKYLSLLGLTHGPATAKGKVNWGLLQGV